MTGNPQTIAGMNTTAQMLSHYIAQLKIYKLNLCRLDLKWLESKVGNMKKKSCKQLDIFLERILYFGSDPEYDIGSVAGVETVTEIFDKMETMVYGILDFAKKERKEAWDREADYTPDIYEHLIGCMEKQGFFIAQQLNLIKVCGGEAEYIAARLEDC